MATKEEAIDLLETTMEEWKRMKNALRVITLDPKISAYLRKNDPKALEQCLRALGEI